MRTKSIALASFTAAALVWAAGCSKAPEPPATPTPTPTPAPTAAAATPAPAADNPPTATPHAIYTADYATKKVSCYDASGKAVSGFTPPSDLGSVSGLAFNPANNTLYACGNGKQAIRTFDATTGAEKSIGFAQVTQVQEPLGLALAGGTLYVADHADGTVRAFNAATGEPVATGFKSPAGVSNLDFLAVRGGTLYLGVKANGGQTVGAFDLATGAAVPGFAPGKFEDVGEVVVSGNALFVYDRMKNIVGEYDATTGTVLNATLLDSNDAGYFAILGNTLFVINAGAGGTLCMHGLPATATPGNTLTRGKANIITGLDNTNCLAVAP